MITMRIATIDDLEEMLKLYIDNNADLSRDLNQMRAGLKTLLTDKSKGCEVLAESQGKIIGRIHVATEWSVYRNSNFWLFENVYVTPEWRRQGVYSIMHRWIYDRAKADPTCCGLRFWALEDNQPARRAYHKMRMDAKMVELFENDFVYGKNNP
jgi:GNAT superfamily N-acetyltransferase|tara:strand:- start:1434 stop:1895 length:462 start_codon:yes stop_codon:yes gene_type:complete